MNSELARGIKIESEHSDVFSALSKGKIRSPRQLYAMIAKAHLKEDPNYYSKLAAIEQPTIKISVKGTKKVKGKTIYTLIERT